MADVSVLNVALYGDPIGTLTHLPGDQTLFAFTQDYIDDNNRPTLSLSFKDSFGGLLVDVKPRRTRIPPFFSNLLPEGALREYLAKNAGLHPEREFLLLRMLGRDLPGAITVMPANEESPRPAGATDDAPSDDRDTLLRFSLAGVQLKFSAVMEAAGGLTIPTEGVGGSWIVKLPSMKFDHVPENEYTMMRLARAIGINVPDVRLVPIENISGLPPELTNRHGNALAVKRFDRAEDGGLVHIEDFAQVFGLYPEKKYERASYRNIAEVLWAETGEDGIAEFIRRLVFNTLIGNADMHLKNWSLIYPDRQHAVLAPGYDFVSTIPYLPDYKMALTLGRSKDMRALSLDQLSYLAGKARLPEKLVLDSAVDTVRRFRDVWRRGEPFREQCPDAVEPINSLLEQIPLVSEV